jgi:hypothetical protein
MMVAGRVQTFPFCGACGWVPFGDYTNRGNDAFCDACGNPLTLQWDIGNLGQDIIDAINEPPSVLTLRPYGSLPDNGFAFGWEGGLLGRDVPYFTTVNYGIDGAYDVTGHGTDNPAKIDFDGAGVDPDANYSFRVAKTTDPKFVFHEGTAGVDNDYTWLRVRATQVGPDGQMRWDWEHNLSESFPFIGMSCFLRRASDDEELFSTMPMPTAIGNERRNVNDGRIPPTQGELVYWEFSCWRTIPSGRPRVYIKLDPFTWDDDYQALQQGAWSDEVSGVWEDM